MMMNETDPRGPKAVALATDAGQWLPCRDNYGRKIYGIRSSRDANHVYFVTRTSCTCYDARRHECKHMLAVRLHCELMAEQAARESVGTDSVAHLDQTFAAVRAAATQAADEDIFARFDQDEDRALARILNPKPAAWARQQRGVIPAAQIERED
jgi:hypothetical protein